MNGYTKIILAVGMLSAAMGFQTVASNAAPPASSYHLLRSISLPGNDGWDYLTVDSSSRRAYIARSTHVTVLNIDSGKVAGDISGLKGIHGVAIDHKSGHGFITDGGSNSVTIFSLSTLAKIRDVAVGEGPDAIIFDPFTGRVFTFNGKGKLPSFTAIDGMTGKPIATVALPGRPEYPVSDGAGHIYDNLEDKSEIAEIDARTLKIMHVWSLSPGDGPSGLTMDSRHRRLFSVCHNGKMAVVDADSGKVLAAPAIGSGPDACVFDNKYRYAFSPNGRDGTVTIVKETSPNRFAAIGTFATQKGARTMAIDQPTHRLLTVTAQSLPPAPGDPPHHRRFKPGTFVVLVYGP